MIIISYGAGLGNQMFEYAFYEKIKRVYPNQIVKLDPNFAFEPAHNGIESFELFNLNPQIATRQEVLELTKYYPIYEKEKNMSVLNFKVLRKIVNHFKLYPSTFVYQDDFAGYFDKFFNLDENKSYYFYGPFVNEKYFVDIKDELIDIFKFPKIDEKKNLEYKKTMEENNSISIHLRRGDYISTGAKLIDKAYYEKAMSIIDDKVENPKYFIFSDSLDLAKEMFGEDEKFVYVEGNKNPKNYRDMQLMSLCKHNITCNSSFSFWGAYLNRNKDKIVISPKEKLTGPLSDPIAAHDSILI